MKRLSSLFLASAIFAVTATFALAQTTPSVAGTWDMVVESPQGKRPSTLIIKQDGDKLTAVVKGARGERPLDSVSLKGDEITMVMTVQFQGSDMVITYTGKVEKDMMKGKADFGGLAEGDWSATPHKADASGAGTGAGAGSGMESISGTWNATVESSQGSGSPVFTFKQEGEKLTGTYKGQLGEGPITGTLKGNDITFSFKVNFQGQDVNITYTGKVEGNSMKGKAMLGDLGEATWTAKKQ